MRYLLVCLFLLICNQAFAEKQLWYFTDPQNCPHCVVLERSLRQADLDITTRAIEVRGQSRERLNQWGVTAWPTVFLIELSDEGKVTKVYKRHDGSMTPAELTKFIQQK